MSLSGWSLLITIGLLNVYHHNPSKPVPVWLDKLVLRLLARVLCFDTNDLISNGSKVIPITSDVTARGKISDEGMPNSEEKTQAWTLKKMVNDSTCPELLKCMRYLLDKEREEERIAGNRDQWVKVGKVLDRFFLVMFSIVMTVTTAIMFPLLKTGDTD